MWGDKKPRAERIRQGYYKHNRGMIIANPTDGKLERLKDKNNVLALIDYQSSILRGVASPSIRTLSKMWP
jgi:hypothetical protein